MTKNLDMLERCLLELGEMLLRKLLRYHIQNEQNEQLMKFKCTNQHQTIATTIFANPNHDTWRETD